MRVPAYSRLVLRYNIIFYAYLAASVAVQETVQITVLTNY